MTSTVKPLKCRKCGHEWFPRQVEVRQCPKCKTTYWDKPKQAAAQRKS